MFTFNEGHFLHNLGSNCNSLRGLVIWFEIVLKLVVNGLVIPLEICWKFEKLK